MGAEVVECLHRPLGGEELGELGFHFLVEAADGLGDGKVLQGLAFDSGEEEATDNQNSLMCIRVGQIALFIK